MSIISLEFLFFVIVSLILFYILPHKFKWYLLLLSSLFFIFINSSFKLLMLFFLIVFIAWTGALLIYRYNKIKKLVEALSIIFIVTILFYCKDLEFINTVSKLYNFLFGNLFGMSQYHEYKVIYLIGISYFSLSLIGYVIDVSWGKYEPEKNYLKLLLFAGYFPAITTGPINKYDDLSNDLFNHGSFDIKKIIFGSERALWGLFKKLVIADRLSFYVSTGFDCGLFGGFYVLICVFLYSLQLYTDFSGSIDICLGVSECFGIKLPENFNVPFASESFSEFWRRWHITMGAWFKEYLLYPILKTNIFQSFNLKMKQLFGKTYGKKLATSIALLIMWIIIGIWHGGGTLYIISSGLLPGLYLFLGEMTEFPLKKLSNINNTSDKPLIHLFRKIKVFLLMTSIWIFMRSNGIGNVISIIKRIFSNNYTNITNIYGILYIYQDTFAVTKTEINIMSDILIICLSIVLLIIVGIIKEKGISIRNWLFNKPLIVRWIAVGVLLFSIVIIGQYGPEYNAVDFIYKGF